MNNDCGFCTIPAERCSDKVRVELRASYLNSSDFSRKVMVIFYIENSEGLLGEILYISSPVSISAGQSHLFTYFLDTRGRAGAKYISAEIICDGERVYLEKRMIQIVSCSTKALPFFDTAWLEPLCYCMGKDKMKSSPEDVSQYLRVLKSVGIHSVIITYTESLYNGIGPFYPSELPEFKELPAALDYDFVGAVLEESDRSGMNVFVGLGRGDDLMLTWDGFLDKERFNKQIDYSIRLASELWKAYGHHISFYGWYIAHEADDLSRANNYYNPVSSHLHALNAAKPVMIAPAGTPIIDSNILNSCDYDIIAYQDAVGSGYIPYVNTFEQERRILMLHDIYHRYEKAHIGTNKHIWTDLEIWKMDGPEYSKAYASSYHQIARQIEIERCYVDSISCYSVPGMFEPADTRFKYKNAKGAAELFDSYKEYFLKAAKAYGLKEFTDQ